MDGKRIIAITVPKAPADLWPVYIGNDLYRRAYFRCGEGDFRIPREEIDAMVSGRKTVDKALKNEL